MRYLSNLEMQAVTGAGTTFLLDKESFYELRDRVFYNDALAAASIGSFIIGFGAYALGTSALMSVTITATAAPYFAIAGAYTSSAWGNSY